MTTKTQSNARGERVIKIAQRYLLILKKEYPWWKRLSPLYLMKKKNLNMIIKVAKMRPCCNDKT